MIAKCLDETKMESISELPNLPPPDTIIEQDIIESEKESSKKWYCQLSIWIKITLGLAVIAFIVLMIIERNTTIQLATYFLNWMKQNLFIGYVNCQIYIHYIHNMIIIIQFVGVYADIYCL